MDPRVHRSRALLREALLGLIREREFEAISVQDITERAGLNRSTFYLHYGDKEEFLAHLMRDMLSELASGSPRVSEGPDALLQGLEAWFRHAAEHAELYQLLLGQSGLRAYALQLRHLIEQRMLPLLETSAHPRLEDVPPPIRSRFLTSAYLGVLESWLDRRPSHPPEQMARWLWALTSCLEGPLAR